MYKNHDTPAAKPQPVTPQPLPAPITEMPSVPEEPPYSEPEYVTPPYTEGPQQRPPYGYYPSCPPMMDPCSPYTYAQSMNMADYGPNPFLVDICQAALQNHNYRTTLWTGNHMQMTLMCIPPCEEIGMEAHANSDQILCVIDGQGMLVMGNGQDQMQDRNIIGSNCCICVPSGACHNIINTGNMPLKLFSCYAPPQHSPGTMQPRRMDMSADSTMG